jgi:hypothetical protein
MIEIFRRDFGNHSSELKRASLSLSRLKILTPGFKGGVQLFLVEGVHKVFYPGVPVLEPGPKKIWIETKKAKSF